MYEDLSMTELTVLQETLYTATEEAYWTIGLGPGNRDWLARYRPVHTEVARLFLEAGEELLVRLDESQERAAA